MVMAISAGVGFSSFGRGALRFIQPVAARTAANMGTRTMIGARFLSGGTIHAMAAATKT